MVVDFADCHFCDLNNAANCSKATFAFAKWIKEIAAAIPNEVKQVQRIQVEDNRVAAVEPQPKPVPQPVTQASSAQPAEQEDK